MGAAPPAVEYPLLDARHERIASAVIHGAAAAVLAAWAYAWWNLEPASLLDAGGVPAWWLATASALGALAGYLGWRSRRGTLRWNGQAWAWQPWDAQGPRGEPLALRAVAVQWDLGPWLLLEATPAARGRAWRFSAARSAAPQRWHALRTAVYHRPAL